MPTTLTPDRRVRSIRTLVPKTTSLGVRCIAQGVEGGRPADPLVEGCEAALEGLLVIREDETCDENWREKLRLVLGVQRMVWNRALVGDARDGDLEMRSAFRAAENILNEIDDRRTRLARIEPPQQASVTSIDAAIERRKALGRV